VTHRERDGSVISWPTVVQPNTYGCAVSGISAAPGTDQLVRVGPAPPGDRLSGWPETTRLFTAVVTPAPEPSDIVAAEKFA
jgi:hypothetical protein